MPCLETNRTFSGGCMSKLKLLIPLLIVLMNSGCVSVGPTVRVETPEPAEDFVLVCDWASTSMFAIHGGAQVTKQNIYIVKSGEETPCGLSLTGGFTSTNVMHPLYSREVIVEEGDITVHRYSGSKLDYLDEQKKKFEAGYWDKYSDPGSVYAKKLVRCGFDSQYLEYYSKTKNLDIDHFKQLYHKHILECLRRTLPISKKYRAGEYGSVPDADEYIINIWEHKDWSKWHD